MLETRWVGGAHSHGLAKTLLICPLSEGMRPAAIGERDTDDKRAGFSLGQIIGSSIGYNKRYLPLCYLTCNRIRHPRIDHTGDDIDLVLFYEFVGRLLGQGYNRAADVLCNNFDITTAGLIGRFAPYRGFRPSLRSSPRVA